MFTVGAEFHIDVIKRRLRSAVAVSLAGMIVPFLFGIGLAWFLFSHTTMFTAKTGLGEAMLFLGAAMCITAFPVLARIIQHKKLGGTTVGAVALGAGAVNDAAAWCLLALVLATFERNWNRAWLNIAGAVVYVVIVLSVVRPILVRMKHWLIRGDRLTDSGLVVMLVLMLASAWYTDFIGLHAVLGAFVMGAAMPRGIVTCDIINRIQPLTVALLLPLYFTFSGLQTKIGLLNSGFLWLMCGAIFAAAVIGKGAACWLAARETGIPNRQALSIGTLMNTRGLMELIIINIGLQRGIISEGLFACLVIMAVLTTLMACPLFDWIAADCGEASPAQAVNDIKLERQLVP